MALAVTVALTLTCLSTCKSKGGAGESGGTTSSDGSKGTATTTGTGGTDRTKGGTNSTETAGTKKGPGGSGSDPETTITADMRQNGFVSASSYQVFVTAFGSSEAEARDNGLAEGRRKALNLMRTDPALRGRTLGADAAEELRRVVQNSSRIVRLQREPNGSWSVVILVEKEGLKAFLRRLR